MVKKLALLVSLVFALVGLHTLVHIVVYGTGISGAAESGISGLSIGGFSLDKDLKPQYREYSRTSLFILAGEWAVLLLISLSAFVKHRQAMQEDMSKRFDIQKYKSSTKTDLDILHDLLKEKKHLRISTIARIFNVKTEIALNWAKTLEAADIATLNYPRVGEPELTLNE